MKRRKDNIQMTVFNDDWLDKLLGIIAILVFAGIVGFLVYSFTVI